MVNALLVLLALAPPLDAGLQLIDRLEATTLDVAYDDTPLGDVLDDLSARLPASIRTDWSALESLIVTPDTDVSLHLAGQDALTVLGALTLTLGDDFGRPVFDVFAGQVVLTTIDALEPMRHTDAYDVRDLLTRPELTTRLRAERPPLALEVANEGEDEDEEALPAAPDDAGGGGVIEIPPDDELDAPAHTPGQALLWLITDHVDPEAWLNFGGSRARISELDGLVMVTATAMTHHRVRRALERLRAARPSQVRLDLRIVEPGPAAPARLQPSQPAVLDGHVVWEGDAVVAVGADYRVTAQAGDATVTIDLRVDDDVERGLRVELEAEATRGGDDRRVETTIALRPPRDAVRLEMPGASPDAPKRVLVVELRRP